MLTRSDYRELRDREGGISFGKSAQIRSCNETGWAMISTGSKFKSINEHWKDTNINKINRITIT
jgi:hypothetical protein